MDYDSDAIRRVDRPIRPYTRALRRWVRGRRAAFANSDANDVYYGRERELMTRLAASYTRPEETLFFDPGAGVAPEDIYILKNQLALYARRRVSVLSLDGARPPGSERPPGAVVLVPSADLARLQARWAGAVRVAVLERRDRYAVIRLLPIPTSPASG